MKLKERRYSLVFDHIKDALLDSEKDVGVSIESGEILAWTKSKWPDGTSDEITYGIRQLVGKGYLDNYSTSDNFTSVKITQRGMDEWLFPMGGVEAKKLFLSYSTADKDMATRIKKGLENAGYFVFMAPEEIRGGAKWLDVIISNLKTCSTFISLRTENYAHSSASEQECGFTLATGKRILALCVGTSPTKMGFCSEYQGEKFDSDPDPIPLINEYCKKQLL